MSLKVIAGEYGGRVLKTPKGVGTRPLLGQVREALFNVLGSRLDGAEVWDLFAGSGASGIEALSRGARRVVFLEKANSALKVLEENLQLLGDDAVARSRVFKADAWDPAPMRLDGEAGETRPDVVFLDPPYPQVAEDPVRSAYRARRLVDRLAPGGVVCFHFMEGHLDEDDFDSELEIDLRHWGKTAVALIGRGTAAARPGPDALGESA